MGKIKWSDEAYQWFKQILSYIAIDHPIAARKVGRGILEKIKSLKSHPEMGYRWEDRNEHIRIILYGHYRIAYEVDQERNVHILGIFHGSLDIKKHFRPEH